MSAGPSIRFPTATQRCQQGIDGTRSCHTEYCNALYCANEPKKGQHDVRTPTPVTLICAIASEQGRSIQSKKKVPKQKRGHWLFAFSGTSIDHEDNKEREKTQSMQQMAHFLLPFFSPLVKKTKMKTLNTGPCLISLFQNKNAGRRTPTAGVEYPCALVTMADQMPLLALLALLETRLTYKPRSRFDESPSTSSPGFARNPLANRPTWA